MGMIYKRKHKGKVGRTWWIKYYRNGKPYRESSKSRKKADAKRLLKKREGEILDGKLPGIYFDRVKFDELADDFLLDYKMNGKDVARGELNVRHLMGHFEGMRVTQITTPRIQDYIEKRLSPHWKCRNCKRKFSVEGIADHENPRCPQCKSKRVFLKKTAKATVNRELSALKRILRLGARQTPPKVARVPYIPMFKENNVRKGFFEHDEFLALRNALPFHLRTFVTFGYKTGWRISEIAKLQWPQVDLKQGIVRIETGETKNDEARTIYLDDELRGMLIRQWNDRKRAGKVMPYVFLNKEGTDRIKRFDKAWKSACKDSGIGVRLFHDFRRTAVRNMVRAGIPERVAMMVSGHKTRSVFERYNIVSDTDLRLAAQKQQAYLEAQTGTVLGTIADFDLKQNLKQTSQVADVIG
jgi:integrase